MAPRDLSSETMTIISRDLLDPEKERPLLVRLSRVAPLLVDLEEAHRDLVEFQNPAGRFSPEMIALNEKAAVLDARHDRKARGIHDFLGSVADLTDDEERSATLLSLRSELFPHGKLITNRSFTDQAGEAERIESRLSERSKRLLRELTIGTVSLEKFVDQWRTAAIELGEVEKQRILLAKEGTPSLSSGKVRNAWISAMNAILAMLDREKGLSPADRLRILGPFEKALAKAAQKKQTGTQPEPPMPEAPSEMPGDKCQAEIVP